MARREYPVISLFSGALGLDLGVEQAGFKLRVAVECNRFAAATIRRNRPDIKLFERRIEDVTTGELLDAAGLKPGEPALVTAGPSCQAFSTAGQRGSMSDPRGVMFKDVVRVVREARPRFFVMENVRGVLSAAVRHRPLRERGPGYPPLKPDEQLGSAFLKIVKEFRGTEYFVVFDILNAADFGVPQHRERVLFIGSRDGEPVNTPPQTHAKHPINGESRWATLRDAIADLDDPSPAHITFPPSKARLLKHIPAGGNWRDLPEELQKAALGQAYVSWGGRTGFCRRLAWDRPTPALTTRPDSKATMLAHPDEIRPLSVAEYAAIQQFPDGWEFDGGTPQKYIQLGNAVPVGLGSAVGLVLRAAMRKRHRFNGGGRVVCADPDLLVKLSKRPKSVLNPNRMRKVKGPKAAHEWLGGKTRKEILEVVEGYPDVQTAKGHPGAD